MMKQTACTSTEKRGVFFLHTASQIFHTQLKYMTKSESDSNEADWLL